MKRKAKVLFVGSFINKSKSGHVGGQMFACKTLLNSRISDAVDWYLIDTTASTNKKRSFTHRLRKSLLRLAKFQWALLTKKIDIVLLFTSHGFSFREKGTMLLMAKFFGKKTILAPRSGLIKNDVDASVKMRNFVSKVIKKTDRVICQGPSWKTYYSKLAGEENMDKFVVVHNWLDISPYLKDTSAKRKENAPVRIIYLGWINKNKGIFDLLEAIKQLKNERINGFVVDVAGNGDAFDEVAAIVENNGLSEIVDLKNWVMGAAKIDLLHSGDIYVLPSYREGYPNSLLEAMSCNLPPIATNVGAIPDVIQEGENGYLISPGDAAMLKNKLHILIQDKQKRIEVGAKAKATVLKNNSVERAVTTFEQVFKDLTA